MSAWENATPPMVREEGKFSMLRSQNPTKFFFVLFGKAEQIQVGLFFVVGAIISLKGFILMFRCCTNWKLNSSFLDVAIFTSITDFKIEMPLAVSVSGSVFFFASDLIQSLSKSQIN